MKQNEIKQNELRMKQNEIKQNKTE